jgi:D-alanyl-lipoteichoic acid acyltransferase DltB (MBOAT superfamily)
MNFNSLQFWVFFPFVAVVYYAVTAGNQPLSNVISRFFLLAVSLFFYACWNPLYLGLILFSVAVTWLSGILMEGRTKNGKKIVLILSLTANLAVLFFFKYYNFFTEAAVYALYKIGFSFSFPQFNVLLPVGISFYTFQALGYSIDMFYGRIKAERNFLNYALFVTFFPQLVAGPIERTANLLPQFNVNHSFDYNRITSGLRLAAWGMFQKMVIADHLAVYVNAIYSNPAVFPATTLALATFFFAFQIYCDFSGYSDIAIGVARILGFDLMVNFKNPYFSRSIADFWRRWHISLSTWLKDYIYIPLGGSRKGKTRQMFNLLLTFLLSGLWHGASFHFVVWGFLHGLFQVIGRTTMRYRSFFRYKIGLSDEAPLTRFIQVTITFVLVCFAWVFFRAESSADAFLILRKFTALPSEIAGYLRQLPGTGITTTIRMAFTLGGTDIGFLLAVDGFYLKACALSFLLIGFLLLVGFLSRKSSCQTLILRCPLLVRWVAYYVIVFLIINSAVENYSAVSQFIYFTF